MSQAGTHNSSLRLSTDRDAGVVTVSWRPSSTSDSRYDAFALIIAVRFVRRRCQWSTTPIQAPSSPVNVDVAFLCRAVGDSCAQVTAQICGFLSRTPNGWKVAETATVMVDIRSATADQADQDLATLLQQLSFSLPSSSLLPPQLDTKCTGPFSSIPQQVRTVSVKLSPEQAVVRWKKVDLGTMPHQWMITLTKNTSEVSTTAYFYTLDGRTSKQKLPVRLTPNAKYTVTITPLFKTSFCLFPMDSHWMYGECTTTFVTPAAELTRSDLLALHRAAVSYCSQSGSAECNWLYRNRSQKYFDDILENCDGVMKVYKKDNGGDPASPINGKLDGLFFMAKNKNGVPPRFSYFGPVRLQVPVRELLKTAPNLYFADFYCMHSSIHQVTLVMTKTGSKSDNLCRAKLLRMSLTDKRNNPFFFFGNNDRLFTCNKKKLEVELLYTEDVNVKLLRLHHGAILSRTEVTGRGHSKPDGIPKNPNCLICNVVPAVCTVECAVF